MDPFVLRAVRPIPRFAALPGDRLYYDPSHPDVLVLCRSLPIRDSGAVLNSMELGDFEEVSLGSGSL